MITLTPLVAAQGQLQNLADSDSLRALVANVPLLDLERIELHPSVKLEGISSITADRAGNIYVIHRPTDPNADPVVVLDHDGTLVRSWESRRSAAGPPWTPPARRANSRP